MKCTRAELLERLSAKELKEWQAYSIIEPFGEEREDWRIASLVHAVLTPHLKKDAKLSVKDCLLSFDKKCEQTPAEIKRIIEGIKFRQNL